MRKCRRGPGTRGPGATLWGPVRPGWTCCLFCEGPAVTPHAHPASAIDCVTSLSAMLPFGQKCDEQVRRAPRMVPGTVFSGARTATWAEQRLSDCHVQAGAAVTPRPRGCCDDHRGGKGWGARREHSAGTHTHGRPASDSGPENGTEVRQRRALQGPETGRGGRCAIPATRPHSQGTSPSLPSPHALWAIFTIWRHWGVVTLGSCRDKAQGHVPIASIDHRVTLHMACQSLTQGTA